MRPQRAAGVIAVCVLAFGLVGPPGPVQAAVIPSPPTACQPPPPGPKGNPSLTLFDVRTAHKQGTTWEVFATGSAGKATFSARVVDLNGAAKHVTVYLTPALNGGNPSADFVVTLKLTAGTSHDGTWTGVATIPKYSPPGYWLVDDVQLSDSTGVIVASEPVADNWPRAWPSYIYVVSNVDLAPPTLSSFHLSTAKVNTSHGRKTITVTVKARDKLSGIAQVDVTAQDRPAHFEDVDLHRSAGTARNATFTGKVTIPAWAGSGTNQWDLGVGLTDVAGNDAFYDSDHLSHLDMDPVITVTSATDGSKPALKSLTFPASVNALAHSQTVSFTVKATDTKSGVGSVGVTFGSRSQDGVSGTAKRVSRTAKSGTWKGTVTFPQCSEPGTWTVASLTLTDKVGNKATYNAKQIKAKHLPYSLTVAALDDVGPVVLWPKTASRTAGVTLKFTEPTLWKLPAADTITVRNDKSGVTVAGSWTCKNQAGAVVCDADGADVVTATWKPSATLSSGELLDFSATAAAPQPVGIYDVSGNPLGRLEGFVKAT